MSTEASKLYHRKLADTARSLRRKGYTVYALHKNYTRPKPIQGFTPDVMAEKNGQRLIVEIKSRDDLFKDKFKIIELAKYAKSQPNVQFDIVLANPQPKRRYGSTEKGAKLGPRKRLALASVV